MTQYLITGRPAEHFVEPWSLITEDMDVGDLVDLTLDPLDEALMFDAGVLRLPLSGGSGSQPWIDRAPAGDVIVPDHGSIVVSDYYTPAGTLTLQGDAVLTII